MKEVPDKVGYLIMAGKNKVHPPEMIRWLNELTYGEEYLSDTYYIIPKAVFPFFDNVPLAQKVIDAAKNAKYKGPIAVIGDSKLLLEGLDHYQIYTFLRSIKIHRKSAVRFIKKNSLEKGSPGLHDYTEIIEQEDTYGKNLKKGIKHLVSQGCNPVVVLAGDSPKISSQLIEELLENNDCNAAVNFPLVVYKKRPKHRPAIKLNLNNEIYSARVANCGVINTNLVSLEKIDELAEKMDWIYNCRKLSNPINWIRLAKFFGIDTLITGYKALVGIKPNELEDYLMRKMDALVRICPLSSQNAVLSEQDIDSLHDARNVIKISLRCKKRNNSIQKN